MILIDTSIWADHFRQRIDHLSQLAAREEIAQHPFVTGELALGNAGNPKLLVRSLELMQQSPVLSHDAVLAFVFEHDLGGTGVGYVDAHLLAASAQVSYRVWTRDKRLAMQAERLGLLYSPA